MRTSGNNLNDSSGKHNNFANNKLWPLTAQYTDANPTIEGDVQAQAKNKDLEDPEALIQELLGPKPQALALWLPFGLEPDEVFPLVPFLFQWDKLSQRLMTDQREDRETNDLANNVKENNLTGKKVSNQNNIVSPKDADNVDIYLDLTLIPPLQLAAN